MTPTPPRNSSPNTPENAGTPDFSSGIPSGAPSASGFPGNIPSGPPKAPGIKTGKPTPPSNAPGFTTHIPQLRNTFPTPPDNADHSAYYDSLNPRQGMSGKTKAILVTILIFAAFFGWRSWRGTSYALADWGTTWEKQVDQSTTQQKPQLVLFTADWCPACNDLKERVLSRKEVTAKLQEQFILTKIDLTDRGGPNSQIAATFGVRVIPTMVVVGPDGSRSDFLTGSVPAERLFDWLDNRKMKKSR
jgi:thiol-disulfide isomerase/thioredoxin